MINEQESDTTQQEKKENAAPATEDTGTKTKRKAHVYNLIIVDESGSMCTLKGTTMSGVNETISTIRKAQEEFRDTQQHMLTLVTFDSEGARPSVRTIVENQPIDTVEPFKDYSPFGCTPLYDAMGQSLSRLHKQVKDDIDASVVVTVMTDGLENASRQWNAIRLRKLIEQLKEEGWVFSYMGSEHDVVDVTRNLAIDNYVEFDHNETGAENTWGRESASRSEYYRHIKELYGTLNAYSAAEMKERKRQYSKNYYSERVTPERVTTLKDNEVFVFGSNVDGMQERLTKLSREDATKLAEQQEREARNIDRREKFYGGDTTSRRVKRRPNIYIFRPEDLDNEDVILAVENTPTYKRTRQMLEDIRNQASGKTPVEKREDADPVQGLISFA